MNNRGVVGAVSGQWPLGAISSVINIRNDKERLNVALNVISVAAPLVLEGSDVPIAYGIAVYDGSQFLQNQVMIPVFTPDPSQSVTIPNGNGGVIQNPDEAFNSGQFFGPN
jgi:hypothetical protein